ncbi:MAG TPA: HAMP domain-containing sensor histidine kinase [Candidatus Paceibacterota bacterium]|nr:HAMP domain-containing sensor histidine kinase [Candidatus Pacearchaeota archaeon]HRZ51305.1 HAMP domain-containing sensor histidine kinase [Candidatus Paceibacterota bacterium]HSA37027.1 HAMP domain-containing sensor histidine kinase [Candidatus Paceibacterota bacterium]
MPESFYKQINIIEQCKKYGIPLWQCPQFLFLLMGCVIMATSITIYLIGSHYISDPEIIVLIVLFLATFLISIAFVIVQSFERLAETNRLKSEFVSIVSHQIRSPLTNLKWIVELLMSGILGKIEEKQTEYFKILKENLERMQELVSELLTVSRIEATKLVFKKEEFSMENLVRDLVAEFKPIAKSSNIKINMDLEKNAPKVYTDPFQILQVVENLLYNAIRYMNFATDTVQKDKEREINIKVYHKNSHIFFEIADNGIGIPKEDQKYIFQKFFRADNVRRYQTNGSGLGLYISKNIIERSGGKIGFESREGIGTTFWFKLPVCQK